MKSIADRLPPEIARQIHPDRRKNETAYWAVRDQLLNQYRDQWIGFADGRVIASGTSPVAVFHAAEATGLRPFFICVGREEEPCRIRRATFPYGAYYPGEALPLIGVEFRQIGLKAVVSRGEIRPLEPLPADWQEGQLLRIEKADDGEVPAEEIDRDFGDLATLCEASEPADEERLERALQEARRQAKEQVRRHMGFA